MLTASYFVMLISLQLLPLGRSFSFIPFSPPVRAQRVWVRCKSTHCSANKPYFQFEVLHESTVSSARVCRITTPHGVIDTPTFVAVATNGALKGLDFRDADAANQQLIFANSYHMLLQPGNDVIKKAGGIHNFVGRPHGPFITDSGGFQVFSLAYGKGVFEDAPAGGELKRSQAKKKYSDSLHTSQESLSRNKIKDNPVKITEDGIIFRSYRDGTKLLLTPESCVQAQKDFGADIIIPLDELPPYQTDRAKLEESVDRSHRWEKRSLDEHLKDPKDQAMYCVVHGGVDKELRMKSVEYLTSLDPGFDGIAIGGSLGNDKDEMVEMLEFLMPNIDKKRPNHLLGIADVESIERCVPLGVDSFDSCFPTRIARHGTLLTKKGKLHIRNREHVEAFGVKIEDDCGCSTCKHYDRAYLNHLIKAKEPVFLPLATVHNLFFMNEMMKSIREKIVQNEI